MDGFESQTLNGFVKTFEAAAGDSSLCDQHASNDWKFSSLARSGGPGSHAPAGARAGVQAGQIDEVVMGCIGQVGSDAFNARRVALSAGLPASAPAYTVNRLCGSGLQAVWSAAMQMRWGGVDIALAGGNESMSRMPFYDFGARSGYKLGNRELLDGTVMMLTDPFDGLHVGTGAEKVARKYGVSRRLQDEFALQ